MSPLRDLLLFASRSVWLRDRAMRYGFVRRAVTRFMPGERLEDALAAASDLRGRGMQTLVTCLGENVKTREEAAAVARHYEDALETVRERGLDCEVSVKLTHLGLDLDRGAASAHVAQLARRAGELKMRLWIDMEDSSYTEPTLGIYRALRPDHPALGVCLQAYLRRTPVDLESLIPLGSAIRLVKGAYKEPPAVAFPKKRDVDEAFFRLARRLLSPEARAAGVWTVIGTHDPALIDRIQSCAADGGVPRRDFEFDLLYGIRRDLQEKLTRDGWRVRVLISYGSSWFPWYMRRLAERPANLWFVIRGMVAG